MTHESAADDGAIIAILKEFGSPGDWGYETDIGRLLYALHRAQAVIAGMKSSIDRLTTDAHPVKDDWFAGHVDCDGNELATLRSDELQRLRDDNEKFIGQIRDTCVRAEKAEAERDALLGERLTYLNSHYDVAVAAYHAGAADTHRAWVAGEEQWEADFGEAALDYAASIGGKNA